MRNDSPSPSPDLLAANERLLALRRVLGRVDSPDQPEEDVPGDQQHMTSLNADLAKIWPSITKRKPALPDADEWKDRTGKLPELKR